MIDHLDDDAAIARITQLCRLTDDGTICEAELVNEFCGIVLWQADVGIALPCFKVLPDSAKECVRRILSEQQADDFPYYHHMSRWHPRPAQWDQLQPHMREVATKLLGD